MHLPISSLFKSATAAASAGQLSIQRRMLIRFLLRFFIAPCLCFCLSIILPHQQLRVLTCSFTKCRPRPQTTTVSGAEENDMDGIIIKLSSPFPLQCPLEVHKSHQQHRLSQLPQLQCKSTTRMRRISTWKLRTEHINPQPPWSSSYNVFVLCYTL